MIVDTSAIVEYVLALPLAAQIRASLRAATALGVGGPTLAETAIVLRARLHGDPAPVIDRFLSDFHVEVIAFGDRHWRESSLAFERFGKGRHPAGLNYGDCLSYAVARVSGEPLLYIGDDFTKTDLGTP